MEALVGNAFVDAKGNSFALKDIVKSTTKVVGLYFSAHWCPPCRQFTPELAKYYSSDLRAKGMEIIFVSSDKDQSAFNEYLHDMPWYGLPFEDRERKNKLSSKFKVEGIPTLVILSPEGELITANGRAAFMNDRKGENLPWKPKSPFEILRDGHFLAKDSVKSFADISKECTAIALYFSASWCGPCHRFTPLLANCYKNMQKADQEAGRPKRFEVIFISSDRDEASFHKYYDEMPWHALSFKDRALAAELGERYDVEGIPSLIVLDAKTGISFNEEAVQAIASDQEGQNFPWTPKAVELLDPSTAGKIGPSPALFVFCGSDEKAKEIQSDLIAAVDVWQGRAEEGAVCHGDVCLPTGGKLDGSEDILFFVAGSHPIVSRVRELAKAEEVVVAMLDLSKPVYAHSDILTLDKVTPMGVRKFVKGYIDGTVAKHTVAPP